MQLSQSKSSPTAAILTVKADTKDLAKIKSHVLERLAKDVKVPGFRAGKVPAELAEKHVSANTLQSEVLDDAINHLYNDALTESRLRAASPPKISLKKYVPFTELEFDAELDVIGDVKLADYKKIRVVRDNVSVSAKDVDEVINSLQQRMAKRQPSETKAKKGDELEIDFKGFGPKDQPIAGASGEKYPIILGSKAFIPGFEDELIGLAKGETKKFKIKFPADYAVTTMKDQTVTFEITVIQVNQLVEPKLDDQFAASVGPFKTVSDLKNDIKTQLKFERGQQAKSAYEEKVIRELIDKTKVELPDSIINEQIETMLKEVQKNVASRTMTWQDFLAAEKMTEDEYKDKVVKAEATLRLKSGIILGEVAEQERVIVTPEEFNNRLGELRARYQDEKMRAELDKPQNQQDLLGRMVAEKTIKILTDHASQ